MKLRLSRRELLRLGGRGSAAWLAASSLPAFQSGLNASPDRGYGVRFTDVGQDAGLTDTIYYGSSEQVKYIVEANGCGVAFYDYDNDGWLDVFVLNGSRLEGFPEGQAPTNRLYKNNRDGTFSDVTKEAGLTRSGWANSVCIGDFDNDGNDDLFVTYWGQNVLYRNNGDGTFTDMTKSAGPRRLPGPVERRSDLHRLQPGRVLGPLRVELRRSGPCQVAPPPAKATTANGRASRYSAVRVACKERRTTSTGTTATARSPT